MALYNSYRKTPEEMAARLASDTWLDADGGYHWIIDGKRAENMVPKDYVEIAGVSGEALARHKAAYDADTERVIAQYRARRAKHGYSAEERYEMQAAFGPDADVVDVLTGKKVNLYPRPRRGGRKAKGA